MKRRQRLGEILKRTGLLTQGQVENALVVQEKTGERLGNILVRMDYVKEEELVKVLAEQYGLEIIQLKEEGVDERLALEMPFEFLERNEMVPVSKNGKKLTVAISDPLNIAAVDDVRILKNGDIHFVLAKPSEIRSVLERIRSRHAAKLESKTKSGAAIAVGSESDLIEALETSTDELRTSDAPVVKLVGQLIFEALRRRASDIHVEPMAGRLRVRYRVDGVLHEIPSPPKTLQGPVTSRLKIMAKLDIAERRLPQDGRIQLNVSGRPIDFRVSTLPSIHGESVVLRILDRAQLLLELNKLGFSKEDEMRWKELIHRPFGILLVTGPTGSGKTTTLYTSLQSLNKPNTKIITVEDPIEYQISGINQVHVRPEIGLSFAAGLRSILRQAPNKIMVGEIRDQETAAVAIEAALTGHLVFSTLHTNDAPSTVSRLLDMNVKPYLVASAVQGILAQRLVRTICERCREPVESNIVRAGFPPNIMADPPTADKPARTAPLPDFLTGVDMSKVTFYKGKGCRACSGTGFFGRIGIFELLVINDEIRELIGKRASHTVIREQARRNGMKTLRDDGLRKAIEGVTTFDEVMRATLGDID